MTPASHQTLPKTGMETDQLLYHLQSLKAEDVRWQDGKAFSLVYYPGKEKSDMIKAAYNLYFSENGLNPTVFPSLRQLEAEVVSITANLLNGTAETTGSMTSGGTESILMALKTAREWATIHKPTVRHPEVILPISAHPAFQKACHYFGLKGVIIPVGKNFRVDITAVKNAITPNTIMLVGSAPSYPQGVIDPISELSNLALELDVLLHVDACVGGFMLPFVRKLGYPVPNFDFTLEGVTSISADVHKYGYAAKGASVILYRTAALRKHQFFVYTDWPGGIYGSPTMTGTRPGGAIAGAWAALNGIGEDGYLELAKSAMETTQKLQKGINDISGLAVLGKPDMSLFSFVSTGKLDIYQIGDEMSLEGWSIDRQQLPPCLHLTVSAPHAAVADLFLNNLELSVQKVNRFSWHKISTKVQVGAVKGLQKVLPEKAFNKLQTMSSKASTATQKRTAAMYGMMGALTGTGTLHDLVIDFMDKLNGRK